MAIEPQLDELCVVLRHAGVEEVMSRFRQTRHRYKADGSLVTEADLAVQRRIAGELAERWPELPLLGEEMPKEEQARMLAHNDAGIWCLDPLDGTSNFAGGFPFFSVSLALIRRGVAVIGLVYDPVRDECFAAQRGAGAWLNGERLGLEGQDRELDDCLALVDLKRLSEDLIRRLGANPPYRSQRSLGSVALEWCWLAAGRFQHYLHGGQRLWDYAAGQLILEQAGGAGCLRSPERPGCREDWDLSKRMAVAAVGRKLLGDWQAWVER